MCRIVTSRMVLYVYYNCDSRYSFIAKASAEYMIYNFNIIIITVGCDAEIDFITVQTILYSGDIISAFHTFKLSVLRDSEWKSLISQQTFRFVISFCIGLHGILSRNVFLQ